VEVYLGKKERIDSNQQMVLQTGYMVIMAVVTEEKEVCYSERVIVNRFEVDKMTANHLMIYLVIK
jgi:hypothetical protein